MKIRLLLNLTYEHFLTLRVTNTIPQVTNTILWDINIGLCVTNTSLWDINITLRVRQHKSIKE